MTIKRAIKDPSWLLERMSNQKVEGNDGPGFRHVRCPKMLWEELVRLVEGLKVEEPNAADPCQCGHRLDHHDEMNGCMMIVEHDEICKCPNFVAAQHLKREQEGRCTCVVMTPRNIYLGGRHLDDSCPVHTIQPREQEPVPGEPMDAEVKALLKRVDEDSKGTRCLTMAEVTLCLNALKQVAAQPPQELVSLREALQKHRYDYDDIHLRAKCSCGWEYDAAVGRHNGWDWWAIHFEAPLASDFAETEKAIRNLSWDESCNGKWTAVVRVEHVLAILRAALTRGAVGGTK